MNKAEKFAGSIMSKFKIKSVLKSIHNYFIEKIKIFI